MKFDPILIKKKLNKIRFYGLNNIQIGYSLVIPLVELIDSKDPRDNIKRIIKNIFFQEWNYNFEKLENDKPMYFFSHEYFDRKDHLESFVNVANLIEGNIIIGNRKRKFCFKKLCQIFFLPIWYLQLRKIDLKIIHKLYLTSYILEIYSWKKFITKYQSKIMRQKALITLFDANMYENILAQIFSSSKIFTATLQHGHFISSDTSNNIFNVAFEGFVSDYFLAWGDYTKNEAIKSGIRESKIIAVGCPKFIKYNYSGSQKLKNNKNNFGVILDGSNKSYYSNVQLLKIANNIAREKKIQYVIRPHPSDDITKYERYLDLDLLERVSDMGESIINYSAAVNFSLVTGSSVYAELIYLKKPVLRYVGEEFIDRYSLLKEGIFKDEKDLSILVDTVLDDTNYIDGVIENSFNSLFASGDIKENYRNVIIELMEGLSQR
jgi:hypothetical protein